MNVILRNATIVTQNSQKQILSGDIRIENNIIREVGANLQNPGMEEKDLQGLVVVPGLIQTHVHLCQALFRNLADDMELLDWLQQRIWPMEMAHNEASLRASARLGLSEMLLSGVTSILDMGSASFMDVVFEEMQQSRIRGFSGKVMMDDGTQPYKEPTDQALEESEALIDKWHNSAGGRIGYALAPRFVLSCSEALWEGIRELSHKHGLLIHSHASENKKELELVIQQTGFNNVEFFVQRQLASSKLCLAHCIWVTPEELDYLHQFEINVLHCPAANLKLGSGFAPVPEMLARGINISLGSDGAPCNNNMDIFMDMRLAALIHKPNFGVTSLSAENVFDMVTLNGAKTLGLAEKIGSIEPGKFADLTVLDMNKVHSIPADNFYSQFVYSTQSRDVKHVMIDGEWVVWEGQLLPYDLEEVKETAWQECNNLMTRLF